MEYLEQLDYFDINTFSDIDDSLKPTDSNIQKELFDSLKNLSDIISNGIITINSGIYENIKQNKGSKYSLPKDCKILSDVIKKNTVKQLKKRFSDSSNSSKSTLVNNDTIEIVVTEADKENDENTFYVNQSMIKQDFIFNVADSSMLFDENSFYSGLDYTGDIATENQSMIFLDANGKNVFPNDGNTNRNSNLLNIKNINEADGNNSTLVNVSDLDKNYIDSNNSTDYWDDVKLSSRIFDSVNDSTYSAIQVNRIQVFPDIRNEYDDINLAKVAMKNQALKNGISPKKLDLKNFNYNETENSNTSFDKDILDITKAIVPTNVEKYNSMGMETKDSLTQSNHSSSILSPSSYLPFTSNNIMDDNTSNQKINASSNKVRNAPSSLNSNSSSIEEKHIVINSLTDFASLQSKFNSSNTNNDNNEYNKIESNHKWSYNAKQNILNNSLDVIDHQSNDNINNFVDDIEKDVEEEKLSPGCQSISLKSPVDLNEEQLTENINLPVTESEIVKPVDNEEEEEIIEFLSDKDDITNENEVTNQSILFEEDTEKIINNSIIDGNLEDHIIIEEEDSIVGNAIEEALENKSYIIQEDVFMDESFVNDLSFTFDGHNAFHKTIKKLNENSQLGTIQENEDENEDKNPDMAQDEMKINIKICLNEAENTINDNSENIETSHSVHENIDTTSISETNDLSESGKTLGHLDTEISSSLKENQEVFDEKIDVSKDSKINNTDVDVDSESETYKNLEIIQVEADEKIIPEIEIIPVESDKLTNGESDKDHHLVDLEEKLNTEDKGKYLQIPSKEKICKKPKKAIKNVKETSSSLSKSKVDLPKKLQKKKSIVKQNKIASKTDKVDLLFANNCVKAFTSSSLKHNIVNTRPIEHEVTVSFSDFDSKINPNSKPKPKPKSKSISKTNSRTTLTSESKVKSLTKSKSIELKQNKPTQTDLKSKTIKKPIKKSINNLTNKTEDNDSSIIKSNRSLKKDISAFIIPELKNKNIPINKNKNRIIKDKNLINYLNSKTSSFIGVTNTKSKKINTIDKKPVYHNCLNRHITYPKFKRKSITHYPTNICTKENTYYQYIKYLLPEYSHKFMRYELSEVMSRSYVFEAIIKKLSPEYKSKDYNPRRNIFKVLLPLENIKKFNEVFEYIQNHMNITMVITAYDLHFGNLSSIFIIIKQLQRYEKLHRSY